MRRDSERPIDSSDDARPSGLSIQSASSAAVAFLRDVRNPETASGTTGAGRLFGFELLARHLEQPLGLVGQAGQFRLFVGRVARRLVGSIF